MIDREAAARAIEAFLRALGHAPVGELEGTGERVADAWADDLLEGEAIDPAELLREGSIPMAGAPGLVVLRDLDVATMCPHHLLPAHGSATVAYMPAERVAGIGTIAHVVDAFARRLTLQEAIGANVAQAIVEELGARGALVKLALLHTCLSLRGEKKTNAILETIAFAGSFADAGPDRELALLAIAKS